MRRLTTKCFKLFSFASQANRPSPFSNRIGMSNPVYTQHATEARPSDALAELALNLRWTWHRSTDELWGRLSPELWELTQNPWVVLQTVSRERLEQVSADPSFRARLDEVLKEQRELEQDSSWFQKAHPDSPLRRIAYFSMEYMLSEALPIYSGGLGNVAGDQLKAASDLGVPVVGVGLLYQQGYFRQEIDASGAQHALYPYNDPGQLPIRPLRQANGEWMRLPLVMPGLKLWIRAWEVRVGCMVLYLLDSNDPANTPAFRGITSELYGGGPDLRIRQEQILGIGGWRLLRALGLKPEVCHLNEGHAAFAVLERAHSYMLDTKKPFDVALSITRAGNIFTTHTAVEAGFDRFAPDLMEHYFKFYAEKRLGIGIQDLLALGRRDPNDRSEPFNMAYLAMHGSGAVNAVSRLHGEVSRGLFQPLFPRWPKAEVPLGYVTNGVHVSTWESPDACKLWDNTCGEARWEEDLTRVERNFRKVTDESLWELRTRARQSLIQYVRKRLARDRAMQNASLADIEAAERIFDADTLTLGFARRFATYKRPDLLLHDPERLVRILTNHERPVQLLIAGKAHPADWAGQEIIKRWNDFIRRADVHSHVVFLVDYDMLMTGQLVQGVDVWINTPRRPWEACGTSGMKVLGNGGLNVSEIDGWWAEAFSSDIGWAIGDGKEHYGDPAVDAEEADALYNILEREVIPEFYTRNERGIPTAWVEKMRESMARLTPAYSASRAVRQYTEAHYLPAAKAYCTRVSDDGKLGVEVHDWLRKVAADWDYVRFGSVHVSERSGMHFFEAQVYTNEFDADSIKVEIYANAVEGGEPVRVEMHRGDRLAGSANGFTYSGAVSANRPANDYTVRATPYHPAAILPLEAPQILWQK